MESVRKVYTYDGPVMEFENCIARRWTGKTYAVSEQKARSNLTFQFKRQYNKPAGSKITLPGRVICKGGTQHG